MEADGEEALDDDVLMFDQRYVSPSLDTSKPGFLDIPLDGYVSTHPHLCPGLRDLHLICLRVINVKGIPPDIYTFLKKQLSVSCQRYYYKPKETWPYIWAEVSDTLMGALPNMAPLPSYAMEISQIMKDSLPLP